MLPLPLRPSSPTSTSAKGATMGELTDRLADLGQWHNGRPVAVTVKFGFALRNDTLSPDPA
jgi:hypothetical protein